MHISLWSAFFQLIFLPPILSKSMPTSFIHKSTDIFTLLNHQFESPNQSKGNNPYSIFFSLASMKPHRGTTTRNTVSVAHFTQRVLWKTSSHFRYWNGGGSDCFFLSTQRNQLLCSDSPSCWLGTIWNIQRWDWGEDLGKKENNGNRPTTVYSFVTVIFTFLLWIKPHLFLLRRKLRLN